MLGRLSTEHKGRLNMVAMEDMIELMNGRILNIGDFWGVIRRGSISRNLCRQKFISSH